MKRIKNILKYIIIFFVLIQYSLFIKIYGIKFCVNSLKKSFFNISINPKYLEQSLNSYFISILKPSCLVKSLAFKKLTKTSNEFILVIGVSKKNGIFESHAWIEKNKKVFFSTDSDINKFKKIFAYE